MFTIPDIHSSLEPLVCWSGAFSEEEIQSIIDIGDNLEFKTAGLGEKGLTLDDVRKSKISWVTPTNENRWLFIKVVEFIARINTDKFQFDLSQLSSLQYTTYSTGEFYTWHIDGRNVDTFGPKHRKLGFSILLSDPETEFTGGEFQFMPSGNPNDVNTTKLKKGDALVFPSFVPHQVTEVASGKRKSLVGWVEGPKFK
jgi:PKHD-type hydroxylase